MAFGSLFLSAGFATALVVQSARGTIVPWVVQVDRLGQAQAVAPLGRLSSDRSADRLSPRALHRAGPIDSRRRHHRPPELAARLRLHDRPRRCALNDYARANDPFAKVGKQQIAVDVSSVIRASPDSFRVAWVERRYEDGRSPRPRAGPRS
jgi:type IV secretion system protein VirB5